MVEEPYSISPKSSGLYYEDYQEPEYIMFNMDFMTADVTQFLSIQKLAFSHERATELKKGLAFQILIKPLICCKKLDIENGCFCCSNTEVPVIS